MRKLFAVSAICALIFTACDDLSDPTGGNGGGIDSDVIGVWTGTFADGTVSLDIAQSTWIMLVAGSSGQLSYNGTWFRDGNTLTLIENRVGRVGSASLSGGQLLLSMDEYYSNTITLTRGSSSNNPPATSGKRLIINNQSTVDLTNVTWQGIDFGSIKAGDNVSKIVQSNASGSYIYFTRATNPIDARTTDRVTVANEDVEFIFTIHTLIVDADNPTNTGTLIALMPQYKIGGTGPGGGTIFFAQGGQYKEVSGELGTYSWSDAVTTANNYRGGGFTDWGLPDRGELDLMYQNLHNNGLGDFLYARYWSSTEYDSSYAWYMNFSTGIQSYGSTYYSSTEYGYSKSSSFRVRAVRSFSQ